MTYSRTVRWLKIGLPLLALAILTSLFLIPRDQGFDGGLIYSTADLIALGEGMTVSNPRFTGATDAGEPFIVSAASATPDGPDPTEVALSAPRAEIDQAERSVSLQAAAGMMHPRDGRIALDGGVRLETTDGYLVTTEAVSADVKGGTLTAPGAVRAVSPHGVIEAGSFRAIREESQKDAASPGAGTKFWFEDGVKVTYDPRPSDDETATTHRDQEAE